MDLHQKFVQLGTQRKNLTRQLQALLPEIDQQKIYLQHGCKNIYEYAWKFAGFSKFLVEKVIRVVGHLNDKPNLKKLIEKEGIHKVAMVATIATAETDKIFARHVENMSKPALFEFAKEVRFSQSKTENHNNENLNLFSGKSPQALIESSPCHAVPEKIKIEFDEEMQILFLQLKKDLKKEFGCEFSHKEALRILLKKLGKFGKQSSSQSRKSSFGIKSDTSQHVPGNVSVGINKRPVKRFIKVHEKRPILEKFNYRCAYPNCQNPYDVIHHRDRFSLSKSHTSIIPLCKKHHEFAHNGLIKNENFDPEKWELNCGENISATNETKFIDDLFLRYSR